MTLWCFGPEKQRARFRRVAVLVNRRYPNQARTAIPSGPSLFIALAAAATARTNTTPSAWTTLLFASSTTASTTAEGSTFSRFPATGTTTLAA